MNHETMKPQPPIGNVKPWLGALPLWKICTYLGCTRRNPVHTDMRYIWFFTFSFFLIIFCMYGRYVCAHVSENVRMCEKGFSRWELGLLEDFEFGDADHQHGIVLVVVNRRGTCKTSNTPWH